MSEGLPPNIQHERRRNDDMVVTMMRQILDSHDSLVDQITQSNLAVAKMSVTLDNQVKVIEKYNNYGQRLILLEQLPAIIENIRKNCATVQAQKQEEAKVEKRRFQVPWGSVIASLITGSIMLIAQRFPG